MTDAITIHVPGEVRGKGRPRFDPRAKRTYTDAKTGRAEAGIAQAAALVMRDRAPLTVPVEVRVTATFPAPTSWPRWKREAASEGWIAHTTRPDADNVLKLVKDALNRVVYLDDSYVVAESVRKDYGDKPGLVITVAPLPMLAAQGGTRKHLARVRAMERLEA